ncbi:hypothetical protein DWX43_17250 [Clostridium sp. AF19-22AC]|nr:hypothetical protein DWX43_17250 [Clostridium sp. AF19-22AC]
MYFYILILKLFHLGSLFHGFSSIISIPDFLHRQIIHTIIAFFCTGAAEYWKKIELVLVGCMDYPIVIQQISTCYKQNFEANTKKIYCNLIYSMLF